MKNIFVVVAVFLLFVSGCAMYGGEEQYNKGEWHGYAGSREVSQIQRDKHALVKRKVVDQMAVDKLMSQPVEVKVVNGIAQGYKGIVQNLSGKKINLIISGHEIKSYFLRPGEKIEDFLLPGDYHAVPYSGNKPIDKGWWFTVGLPKYVYNGKNVHWYYAYTDE